LDIGCHAASLLYEMAIQIGIWSFMAELSGIEWN
jgi:hypothetical protein